MAVPRADDLPPEEQDWHRFGQLHQLHNHWQRPGWSEGRRSYHWFLTFEDAASLRALTTLCQEPFRDLPQFDLVPLHTLHLTLERVAFTDELSATRLPEIVDVVSQRCRRLDPLRLEIGWLAASGGAIRFTVLPVERVADVRRAVLVHGDLTGLRADVSMRAADSGFWPHVSIAYSNAAQPASAITETIEALRLLPPVKVLVSSAALVELRREGAAYRWDEVERVEFAGQ